LPDAFDQLSQAIDEGMLLLNLLGVGARLNHGGHLKKAILGLPWPIACANNVQGGCNVFDTFWDALFFWIPYFDTFSWLGG